jgi:hypothetical protein
MLTLGLPSARSAASRMATILPFLPIRKSFRANSSAFVVITKSSVVFAASKARIASDSFLNDGRPPGLARLPGPKRCSTPMVFPGWKLFPLGFFFSRFKLPRTSGLNSRLPTRSSVLGIYRDLLSDFGKSLIQKSKVRKWRADFLDGVLKTNDCGGYAGKKKAPANPNESVGAFSGDYDTASLCTERRLIFRTLAHSLNE